MNQRQEELLVIYRKQWEELSAINALRADLEARAREIHASQRQLANKIAVLGTPARDTGLVHLSGAAREIQPEYED